MVKKLKHDSLVKTIMTDPIAAQEFLEYYLPEDFKKLVDLSKITVEQESYIEESLNKKYSDIVYKISTKCEEEAFVYALIEAQSTIDYWTALRLWKYTLLLCERHKKGKDKLPLVCNLVIYNGKKVYNAPRNLWSLFTDSVIAKKLMTEDYQLVDLQAMSDDEIIKKKHLGMLEYMMKHIHMRDMIKLWEKFLTKFKHIIILDKEKGYIYLRSFLWYTDTKLPAQKQPELVQVFTKHLLSKDKDSIMKTVAQKYAEKYTIEGLIQGRQEGIQQGRQEGIQQGRQEGIKIGEAKGEHGKAVIVEKEMFTEGFKISLIAKITGLQETFIRSIVTK